MSRLRVNLSQFALVAGRRRNHTDAVICRESSRRALGGSPTQLYLLAEHATVPGYDHELGHIVMQEVELAFADAERRGRGPAGALAEALAAVNQAMWEEGQSLPPHRRVPIGLVAITISGNHAYVCQVGSGQLLVGRRGELAALPTLGFWHALHASAVAANQAMGQAPDLQPAIAHCLLQTGDLLLLCSSNLARVIEPEALADLVGQPIELVISHLTLLAEEYGLQNTSGVAVQILQAPGRAGQALPLQLERLTTGELADDQLTSGAPTITGRLQGLLSRLRPSSQPAALPVTPAPTPAPSDLATTEPASAASSVEALPDNIVRLYSTPPLASLSEPVAEPVAAPVAVGETPYSAPRRPQRPLEPTRHTRWLDILAAPMILASESMRRAPLPAGATAGGVGPAEPRRRPARTTSLADEATTGRRRGERARWSSSTIQIAAILAIVTGALLVAVVISTLFQSRSVAGPTGTTSGEAARGSADVPLWRPVDWPVAERSQPAPSPTTSEPARADTTASDLMNRTTRLSAPIQLADLSGSGSPTTTAKQVAVGPGGVYVLDPYTSTLYLIDQSGKEVTPLLAKGWTMGRQKVTDLIGMAWRGDTLVAMDRERVYTMDGPNGTWRTAPLAAASLGLGVRPVNSFEGNLYLLDPATRQVYKFAQGAYARPPQRWLRAPERVDLTSVVDIAIDGRIYALTASGQIVSMLRGELEKQITPEVTPAVQSPVAMVNPSGSAYLYIAEASGRILKLSKDGQLVRQYRLPEGSSDLSGLSDFAVNEATGTIYAVAGNRVLRLNLPTGESGRLIIGE